MDTNKDHSTRNILLLILLGSLVTILIGLNLYQYSKRARTEDESNTIKLVNSMGDTLKYYKGRDSVSIARISSMETESAEAYLKLKSSTEGLKELQGVVDSYKEQLHAGNSATLAMIETINSSTHPTIVKVHDTLYKDPPSSDYTDKPLYVFPSYEDSLNNEWINYYAKMTKDSAKFTAKIFNKFSVVNGKDKKGAFADITNYNPYSSVKTIRSYQVSQPVPKRLGLGVSAGVTYYDKFRPYVGIGLNYNLINLK